MSTVQTMVETGGTPMVDAARPWPGLFAFTEKQSGYFFGRDKETDELFRLVKRETITVLYGKSGLGKSSLLQAGLFPCLRTAQFLPVYIRLKYGEVAGPLESQIKAALKDAIDAGDFAEAATPDPNESLWEYLHHRGGNLIDRSGEVVTPVVVLDQFEEIFTLGVGDLPSKTLRDQFLVSFADLAENTRPQALSQRFAEDPGLAARFDFNTVGCRFVIALREEFVTDLDELRKIPSLSSRSCRMSLKELNGLNALDVVSKPNPDLVDSNVAELIVRFVARDTEGRPLEELEVAPAILSLFCRELSIKRGDEPRITSDLVKGNAATIIDDFYSRCVDDTPEALRYLIEDELVVSGYRNNIDLAEAKRKLEAAGVSSTLIDELVNERVLHVEDFRGNPRLELTHDVLLEPVKRRREQRRQREALEQEKRQRAEAERRAEEESRQRGEAEKRADTEAQAAKRLRILLSLVGVLLVLAVVAGFFAFASNKLAQHERLKAIEAAQRAERNEMLARTQAAVASAEAAISRNDFELATLLSAYAMKLAGERGYSDLASHAESTLRTALISKDGIYIRGEELLDIPDGIALAPDGAHVALTDDKQLYIFDVKTGKLIFKEKNDSSFLAWSPDGKWLADGKSDVHVRDWAHPKDAKTMPSEVEPPFAWHPQKSLLATDSGEHELELWEVPSFTNRGRWKAHERTMELVAWSPDGTHIATASADGMLKIWDSSSHKLVAGEAAYAAVKDTEDTGYAQLEWSQDNKHLLTADMNMPLRIRDATNAKVEKEIPGPKLSVIALSHNGKWLLRNPISPSVPILDGQCDHQIAQLASPEVLGNFSWSSDDAFVAASVLTKGVRIYSTEALRADSAELLKLARAKVSRDLTPAECAHYLQMQTCPPRP